MTIAKGSGDPNAESTIRLRGVISLQGGSTPLVLVDGIEGGLGTVSPENIASIDVLKDASAAAIYGTRGANGVILITTKNGQRESRTAANYSGYMSLSKFGKTLDFYGAEEIRQGLTNYADKRGMIRIGWMRYPVLHLLITIILIFPEDQKIPLILRILRIAKRKVCCLRPIMKR